MKKVLLSAVLIGSIGLVCYTVLFLFPKLNILNGYAAKKACSCYYISGRTLHSIQNEDLAVPPLNMAKLELDTANQSLSATVFGLARRTAYFSRRTGCVLNKRPDSDFAFLNAENDTMKSLDQPWPLGKRDPVFKKTGIDTTAIQKALDLAFDQNSEFVKKTRALLVIQDDSLVAERYAEGYDAETELLGWSMSKSITNILLGILVKKGRLNVSDTALFSEWKDKRREISIDDLLRMSSGLEWEEVYSEVADATNMLFMENNMPAYVLKNTLEFSPGSHFEYSSGTTNLLSLLMRRTFSSDAEYHAFPYRALFDKLSLDSLVLETDATGHYVLSSYCFATPREWAKLGLLYLHKGSWLGENIFDESWYTYSLQPSPASANGAYGAHIWLNSNHNDLADAPETAFRFSGYEGQYVYVIPSYNAVVVRMGLSEGPPFDMNAVMKSILEGLQAMD